MRFFLFWAFEFGVLYLLYRYVLSDIQGVWFFVFVGATALGYLVYLFGEFFDWRKEHEKQKMFEKIFS